MEYSLSEERQHGGIDFSLSFTVFKHTQEGFQYQPQLFPMTPPTTNPAKQTGELVSDIANAATDLAQGIAGGG